MSTSTAMRARYADDAINTASPARLLVMLWDRLVRDLVTAQNAIEANDLSTTSDNLVHAQAILLELNTSLDADAWDGAAGLSALYVWLHGRLMDANVAKDAAIVAECREIIEPLRDAWRQAALASLQSA